MATRDVGRGSRPGLAAGAQQSGLGLVGSCERHELLDQLGFRHRIRERAAVPGMTEQADGLFGGTVGREDVGHLAWLSKL